MTYVIHGATGAQGAPVVSALAAAGKPVTAITRNEKAVVNGARVVAAAYSSATDLTDAYRGAAGVFVHLPITSEEDRQIFADNILTAVRETRPARVVFSTSGLPIDPAIGGAAATLARRPGRQRRLPRGDRTRAVPGEPAHALRHRLGA